MDPYIVARFSSSLSSIKIIFFFFLNKRSINKRTFELIQRCGIRTKCIYIAVNANSNYAINIYTYA